MVAALATALLLNSSALRAAESVDDAVVPVEVEALQPQLEGSTDDALVLVEAPRPPLEGSIIVLDAGHGGSASGAVAPRGLRESDLNLAVTLDLYRTLLADGATVVLTRVADTDVLVHDPFVLRNDLVARAAVSNSISADLFVSLHHNAFARRVSERTAVSMNRTEVYYNMFGASASSRLGEDLFSGLHSLLGAKTSEVLAGAFAVLRFNKRPAVLGEPYYMTSRVYEGYGRDPKWIETEAARYALGIRSYWERTLPEGRILRPALDEVVRGDLVPVLISTGGLQGVTASVTISGQLVALDALHEEGPDSGAVLGANVSGLANGFHEMTLVLAQDERMSPAVRCQFLVDRPPHLIAIRTVPRVWPQSYQGPIMLRTLVVDGAGNPVADGKLVRLLALREGGLPRPVNPDPPASEAPGSAIPYESTSDPSTPDPSTPDPSTPDPSTPDPSTSDPSTPDPSTSDPSTPDPSTSTNATPDPLTLAESLVLSSLKLDQAVGTRLVWSDPPLRLIDQARSDAEIASSTTKEGLADLWIPPIGAQSIRQATTRFWVQSDTLRESVPSGQYVMRPLAHCAGRFVDEQTGGSVSGVVVTPVTSGAYEVAVADEGGGFLVVGPEGRVCLRVSRPGYLIPGPIPLVLTRMPEEPVDLILRPSLDGVFESMSIAFDHPSTSDSAPLFEAIGEQFKGTGIRGVHFSTVLGDDQNVQDRVRFVNGTPAKIALTFNGLGIQMGSPVSIQFYHSSPPGRSISEGLKRVFSDAGMRTRQFGGGSYFINNTPATALEISFGTGSPRKSAREVAYLIFRGLASGVSGVRTGGGMITGRAPETIENPRWIQLDTGDRAPVYEDLRFTFYQVSSGSHLAWFPVPASQAEDPSIPVWLDRSLVLEASSGQSNQRERRAR